jgi:hypothetical protein
MMNKLALFYSVTLLAFGMGGCGSPPSPTSTATPPTPTAPPPTPTSAPTATAAPSTPTATPTFTAVPATPTALPPTPTSSPVPTLVTTATPHAGPVILYFRADVTEADPGESITLEWQSSGATQAALNYILPSGQYGDFWAVEPSGSMDYAIPAGNRNAERFELAVYDAAGRSARVELRVPLRCPDAWFFSPAPDECPGSAPLFTDGAEQHFERGVMLWNRTEDRVYVLSDDRPSRDWQSYTDEWDEGEPESDPNIVPPAGLYQPVRGFGLVWREQPGVRERLGWAVDTEAGYPTAIQGTSRFKYNDTYVKALDGGVWHLGPEGSSWRHIP